MPCFDDEEDDIVQVIRDATTKKPRVSFNQSPIDIVPFTNGGQTSSDNRPGEGPDFDSADVVQLMQPARRRLRGKQTLRTTATTESGDKLVEEAGTAQTASTTVTSPSRQWPTARPGSSCSKQLSGGRAFTKSH